MTLVTPYWFPARQGKAESAGDNTYRLTAPNLQEAYVAIRQAGTGLWSAALRLTADGPDVAVTGAEYPNTFEAWEAAFELYRKHVVV